MNHSWNIRKFGDICTSELGKTRDEKRNKGSFRPYLCAINVQWDRFELSDLKEMRFEDNEYDRYTVRKGDLVICEGGDIGRAAIWDKEEPIHYQNALHRVRFDNGVNARFILYYLYFLKQAGILDGRYGKGVTITHLVKSSLLSIPVPVPPLNEQQRIVDELDLLTGIIDKKNAQLRDLDALAQSIFYEMFGDPIANDRGWPAKAIGEFAEVTDYVANGSFATLRANVSYKSEPDYAVLVRLADFSNGFDKSKFVYVDKHAYDFLAKSKLLGGEIIMSNVGSVGKAFLCPDLKTPMSLAPNSILIRTPNSVFSFACFKMPSFQEAIRGITSQTALPKFNKTEFKKIRIINPDAFSQKQFEEKWQAIKFKETSIIASLNDAKQLLDSRMAFYFS